MRLRLRTRSFLRSSRPTLITPSEPFWALATLFAGARFYLFFWSDNIYYMDIVSHALIGKIFCFFDKKAEGKNFWVVLFSIMPDFVLIPFYIVLGKEYGRTFWIAQNVDWAGASITHPALTQLYNITHSLLFALIIILPAVFYFKLPKSAFFVYIFHIIADILTHTGEWAIQIFYPFKFTIAGFSDAWAWPLPLMAISWLVLLLIIFYLSKFSNKKNGIPGNKS